MSSSIVEIVGADSHGTVYATVNTLPLVIPRATPLAVTHVDWLTNPTELASHPLVAPGTQFSTVRAAERYAHLLQAFSTYFAFAHSFVCPQEGIESVFPSPYTRKYRDLRTRVFELDPYAQLRGAQYTLAERFLRMSLPELNSEVCTRKQTGLPAGLSVRGSNTHP